MQGLDEASVFVLYGRNQLDKAILGIEPTNEESKACREYAAPQLEVAEENNLYICGMHPLEPDNPMHKLIFARYGF
jgi:hypothetical protein